MFQTFTQVFVFLIVGAGIMAIFYETAYLHKKLMEWKGVNFTLGWLIATIVSTALLGVAAVNESQDFRFWASLATSLFLFILPILIDWQKRRK